MQTRNPLLDDLARVAVGALGVASGMRAEVEARLRDRFESVLSGMDLVTREEFEAVKAMAVKAREEQEDLAERLSALQARLDAALAESGPARKPRPAKKSAKSGTKSGNNA